MGTVPIFSKEEFNNSTAPYEYIYQFKDNKLKMQQLINQISEQARMVGIRNFSALFKMYVSMMNNTRDIMENSTNFEGQELDLNCGSWICDDKGVTGFDKLGFEVIACNHPIMPVQRLINIDTNVEKLKLAYKKSKQWRYIIADKKTLASSNSIISLADYGIAVTSENAKNLVRYLNEIEYSNYEEIEEVSSVGRLGWIDDYGFSPYVEDLVFDGDLQFKHYFDSVKEYGAYDEWINTVREIRKNDSVATRIILAGSFASALVKVCDALPFFVHIWGGSETGKTVGLMLAASVWASPKMGDYMFTFNGTEVSQELAASFFNSLPLIIDELQMIKDQKSFDKMIYKLAEGIGKSRGLKSGGLQKLGTWQNCIISSGEMPISNSSSGGGAVNRIVEIDCADTKLFSNPVEVVKVIKRNYGYAGKIFIEKLSENMEYARDLQSELYKLLSNGQTTEKQALSASLILTADKLIDEWIFNDGCILTVEDIEPFLVTKQQMDVNKRALNFIYDTVSANAIRFNAVDNQGEVWGEIDNENIYIIKSIFDRIMMAEGYNPLSFLSWANRNGLIQTSGGKNTKTKRINGYVTRCVCIERNSEVDYTDDVIGDLPF